MINQVVLMGRLTRDPELRNTASGTSVCNFTVAVDDGYGENKITSFINCVAWGKTAEFVERYFSKGKMIIVCGKIQTRTWDGQDGRKCYATEVVAREVNFGESKKDDDTSERKGGTYSTAGTSVPAQTNRRGDEQQRIEDIPGYDDWFKMINDEDDDLPF